MSCDKRKLTETTRACLAGLAHITSRFPSSFACLSVVSSLNSTWYIRSMFSLPELRQTGSLCTESLLHNEVMCAGEGLSRVGSEQEFLLVSLTPAGRDHHSLAILHQK